MFHKNITVPEKYIGLVIGKRGNTIKKLECKHSVKIVFNGSKFDIFSVDKLENVNNASSEIVSIYQKKAEGLDECPICMETLEQNSNYVVTKCGHKFHFDCLMKALETSDGCPMCRQPVKEKKDMNVDKIINETILVMRRTNYWTYLYTYMTDIFDLQVVLEQFMKEPIRYALSKVK